MSESNNMADWEAGKQLLGNHILMMPSILVMKNLNSLLNYSVELQQKIWMWYGLR